jgi:hypothetical protein
MGQLAGGEAPPRFVSAQAYGSVIARFQAIAERRSGS